MSQTADSTAHHEMEMVHAATEQLQDINTEMVQTSDVLQSITLVRRFIIDTTSVCYGGTAINNILPESARFYKSTEIPDFDFYHPDAIQAAKQLADILHKNGYISVAKAGMHVNTYKVYANFIPVADITQLDLPLFTELSKRAIIKKQIRYADPDFLRMAMYLELSHPKGDISRWEKVNARLILLNTYYPMDPNLPKDTCPVPAEASENELKWADVVQETIRICIQKKAVFFGGFAVQTFQNVSTYSYTSAVDVLFPDAEELATFIQSQLLKQAPNAVRCQHTAAVGEIVPEYYTVTVHAYPVAYIYQTIACHNYNEIKIPFPHGAAPKKNDPKKKKIDVRVATIDTIINITLALSYADNITEERRARFLCMARYIFEYHQKHRLDKSPPGQRFVGTCLGNQDTLTSILKNKYEIFVQMKKDAAFKNKYYDKYFLNYNPGERAKRPKAIPVTKTKVKAKTIKRKKEKEKEKRKQPASTKKKRKEVHPFAAYLKQVQTQKGVAF